MRVTAAALVVASIALTHTPARADSKQCVADNEQGNELRQKGKFKDARQKLLACAAASCPKIVREECQSLLSKVDASLPTVVFSAVDDQGNDVSEGTLYVDDEKLADSLGGRALEIDPGEHKLRIESASGLRVERTFVVREGEKNRNLRIELKAAAAEETPAAPELTPTEPDAPPPPPPKKGPPAVAYVLGGVGIVALGAFGYFAIKGKQQENDLESRCAPNCQQSEADSLHQKYLIADIALGVGVLSLAGATYFFLSAPKKTESARNRRASSTPEFPFGHRPSFAIGAAPLPGGARAALWSRF